MYWDDLIEHWRKGRRANSPRLLRAAGGHVAVLPSPRRRRRIRPLVVALAIIVLLLLLLFGSGSLEPSTDAPEPTLASGIAVGW
ncbi:MAG TPA: hypothetical protein VIH00_01970 [Candidatus Limnocylindrales bacterium]